MLTKSFCLDLSEAVRHLAETYQLVLKLAYTSQRGFHVTYKIPKSTDLPDLPQEFMKITKSRGVVSMTTDKLVGYLTTISLILLF